MFASLRHRFGVPGVISVFALVFALLGGAYAAGKSGSSAHRSTASASAKAKKGPRGPRGATGPQGSPGLQGAPGRDAVNGKDGAPGKEGPEGEEGLQGKAGKAGTNGTPGAPGDPGLPGPPGPEGNPWTAGGTLPSGETETGTYAAGPAAVGETLMFGSISFAIPLAAAPTAIIVTAAQSENEEVPAGCGGNTSEPEADPGNLCVFEGTSQGVPGGSTFTLAPGEGFEEGLGKTGKTGIALLFILNSTGENASFAVGTWAVTAGP